MRYPFLQVRRYVHLISLAVILLTACSTPKTATVTPEVMREAEVTPSVAEAQSASQPAATYTPYPTHTPYPTYTPLPTPTLTHTPTVTAMAVPTATETATPTATATSVPTVTETATATEIPTAAPARLPVQPVPVDTPATIEAPSLGITRLEDNDPGPPFTILVSTTRVQKDGKYKVTGTVRNHGSETYEGIGVIGTFFGDAGLWYGPVDAHCPCLFLEPGAECPFSLEIYPGDYVEYLLHPEGRPVEYRQPASLVLSDLNLSNDGVDNVRITGMAINENEFTVKNAIIAGALIDASGQIVSLGSTFVLKDVMPGAGVAFDLRIKYEPYSHYQLYVQAIRN